MPPRDRQLNFLPGVPGADAGSCFPRNRRTFQGAAANFRAFRRFWCGSGHTPCRKDSPAGRQPESPTDDQKRPAAIPSGIAGEMLEQGDTVPYTIVSTVSSQDFSFLPLHLVQHADGDRRVMPSTCVRALDEFTPAGIAGAAEASVRTTCSACCSRAACERIQRHRLPVGENWTPVTQGR